MNFLFRTTTTRSLYRTDRDTGEVTLIPLNTSVFRNAVTRIAVTLGYDRAYIQKVLFDGRLVQTDQFVYEIKNHHQTLEAAPR